MALCYVTDTALTLSWYIQLALGTNLVAYYSSGSCGSTADVNNFSSVISPAEFLSLTAFSICSTPSRVKWFAESDAISP